MNNRTIHSSAIMQKKSMSSSISIYSPRISLPSNLDPFINFDEFHMSAPTFPPHPHAGFTVLTYLFEDSEGAIINRDSFGDHSRIAPGGLHWTQAGRGAMHEEHPERPYKTTHGLQLWVNHSQANRNLAPRAIHAEPEQIQEAYPVAGARVRVLSGEAYGVKADFTPVTPITLLDIHLQAHTSLQVPIPSQYAAFINVIKGNGNTQNRALETHTIAKFNPDGDAIEFTAGQDGMNLLLGAGIPLNEPVVFGGPFIGGTQQDILEAQKRYANGEMGRLESSA
jgi:redox-sensitive bicupin YhaK (pirin superfamily)